MDDKEKFRDENTVNFDDNMWETDPVYMHDEGTTLEMSAIPDGLNSAREYLPQKEVPLDGTVSHASKKS